MTPAISCRHCGFPPASSSTSVSSTNDLTTVSSTNNLASANVSTALTNSINTSALTGLTNGAGSFTINGQTIGFNISKDSISSIIANINNSNAGVLASYNPGTGNITITNQQTGSLGITMTDSTGLLAQLGLTGSGSKTTYGVNAQFTVNGSSAVQTSNSNVLTSQITGIPGLTVTANEAGSDTITVSANTTQAQTNLQTFITAYNQLNTDINYETQITVNADGTVSSSPLSENQEQDWMTTLREDLFKSVNNGSSTVSSISQIGLDFNESDGSLSISDQAAFTSALNSNPEAVAEIFNTPTGGLANVVNTYIQNLSKTGGIYQTQTNALNTDISSLHDRVSQLEIKINDDQTNLTNSFQSMESAISNVQNQEKILNSMLGTTNTVTA